MDKLKIGHVGLGDIAFIRYLPCYGNDNLILSAVCTRDENKLKRTAEKLGINQYYTDHKEMLKEADIDALVITTPTPSHYQIVMDCIKAGKHVLIEKPLTTKLKEAQEIVSEAKKQRIKLMVLPYTNIESLNETKILLKEKILGKVLNLEATMIGSGVSHSDWFYKQGGGELNDFAIYPITWMVGLIGSAKEVVAFTSIRLKERQLSNGKVVKNIVEDTSAIMLKWENGILGTISSNWATRGIGQFLKNDIWRGNPIFYLNIYGTDGLIHCDTWLNAITVVAEGKIPEKDKNFIFQNLPGSNQQWFATELSKETWGGAEILRDFAYSITNDTPVVTNLEQTKHVIEIIEKAYKSIKTGVVQKLETRF